jgi:HEAT repeat protein
MIFGPSEKKIEKWRDERNLPALMKVLAGDNPDLKAAAIDALGEMRAQNAVDDIMKALTHPISSKMREAAARSLAKLKPAQAIDSLIKSLNDDVPSTRKAAKDALIAYGEAAYPNLRNQLNNYYHDNIRMTCGELLKMAGSRAVSILISGLKDGTSGVREESAILLGEIGDPMGQEQLVEALADRRILVRLAAAKGLDRYGFKPPQNEYGAHFFIATGRVEEAEKLGAVAIEPLVGWLTFKDMDIRRRAALALRRLDWRPRTRAEAADFWAAAGKFSELVKLGPDATDALVRLLSDENIRVKKGAAQALKKIGVPAQVRQLVKDIELSADFTLFRLPNDTFNLQRLALPGADYYRGKLFLLRVENCDDAQIQHIRKLYPGAEIVSEQVANTL